MSDYDVIVVGGGPAGSTTARRCAQKGMQTLLMDKARFPRDKPCAGGIRNIVRELLDFPIDEVVHRRVYGQRFYSPSGLKVECIRPQISGDLVMREEFDHLLFRKAGEAGAELWDGTRAVGVAQDSDKVTVALDDGRTVTADFVVGADGINSTVARSLGFYEGWKRDTAAVAIEVEVEVGADAVTRICGVPFDREGVSIDIFFGPVPYGYVWCFPKRSVLSLGAGCRQDRAQNIRQHFNKWLESFVEEHDIEPEIVSDSAARLPYSGAAERTVVGRALLVGDAAGFVNPFSGEGIPMAIESGIIAADVLNRAVREKDPKLLREYEGRWKKRFMDDLKVGKSIAKLVFKSEKNMETVLRLAYEDEYIRDIMYKMIAELDTYERLKRQLVRRILTRHARAGLSLYT